MQNLHLLYQKSTESISIDKKWPICAAQAKHGLCYIGNYQSIQIYECSSNIFIRKIVKNIPDLSDDDFIISLEYLENIKKLCIGTRRGLIIIWEQDSSDEFIIQSEISEGMTCMKWNHTQTIYSLHSEIGGIFTWDCYFQNPSYISNMPLNPTNQSISESQAVGWGKKSTQFIGQGKKPTSMQPAQLLPNMVDYDNHQVIISWRQDGQYLSVSAIDDTIGYRRIRVWSDKGSLFSTCELTPSLCPVLSWIPSECWITSAVKLKDNYEIVHFEKNGLRRCSFTLINCSAIDQLISLQWTSTSDVLAIHLQKSATSKIQLYTISNSHWYLKSEIEINHQPILLFSWLNFDNYTALIQTEDMAWYFDWDFKIDQSNILNNYPCSLVGVQDGPFIQFTPFFKCSPPPPYSTTCAKLSYIPSILSISQNVFNDRVRILTTNSLGNSFTIIDVDLSRTESIDTRIEVGCEYQKINPTFNAINCSLRHLRWLNSNTVFAIGYKQESKSDNIFIFEITSDFLMNLKYTTQLDFDVICVSKEPTNDFLYLQSTEKSLYNIDLNAHFLCTKLNDVSDGIIQITTYLDDKIELIFLTKFGELFINDKKLFDYCTGFLINEYFLLVVLKTSTLFSIPLNRIHNFTIDTIAEGFKRNLEMGSKLISANFSSSDLLLQMPRGNIEIINPRPLVINKIQKLLDRGEYYPAYKLIKQHRIDSNVLFDHNPTELFNDVNQLVNQFQHDDLVALIGDLKEIDVTATTYGFMYTNKIMNTGWLTKKLEIVSKSIRNCCIKIDEKKFKKPIMLCLLKESISHGPEYVMKYILSLPVESKELTKSAALKFLKLYIPGEELYKKALETYDLELALMTAQATNKDPKEFLPYLQKLKDYSINFRAFIINKDLKNYRKALEFILKCDDKLDECLVFIDDKKLYNETLAILEPTSAFYKPIALQFVKKLIALNKHYEAAIIYASLECYDLAFTEFCECGNYKQAIFCINKQPSILTHDVTHNFRLLASLLVQNMNYKDAAKIYGKYLDDKEEALRTLISGSRWEDSFNYSHKINSSKATQIFTESLNSKFDVILSKMEIIRQTIASKTSRLITLREERSKFLYSQGGQVNFSDFSDTESFTGSTNTSGSTNTRKRKEKKKKQNSKFYRSKIDSPYEEFALMNDLYELYISSTRNDSEACDILLVYMLMLKINKAKELKSMILIHRSFLAEKFNFIWTPLSYLGPVKKGLSVPNTDDVGQLNYGLPLLKIPNIEYENTLSYSLLD